MLVTGNQLSSIYQEAFKRLDQAIKIESSWSRPAPQPYASLFSGTVKYLKAGGALTSLQKDKLVRFIDEAERLFLSDAEIEENLEMIKLAFR
jgi:hypothetical protein